MIHREIEDLYTLTPLQEGLLFHALREPEGGFYVDQLSMELAGELDVGALRAAWRRVIDRHPALRSSFHWRDASKPLQAVHREVELPFELEDWSAEAPPRRERRLEALLAADQRRGFRLERAPLMRLTLVRFGPADHRLLWSFHHVALDGWSLAIVSREVFACYRAAVLGERLELAPAPPFRAFVSWLRGRRPEAAEGFWRRELKGFSRAPPVLADERPGDPAPAEETAVETAAERDPERHLPAPLAAALQRLAGRRRLTSGSLFLGAWSLLLGRLSGSDDVVFGLTVAGRPEALPGVEETVGTFLNTLPFRARLAEGAQLGAWLGELQERRLAMQPFEHTPLVDLRAWSEVAPGRPLFETLLVIENLPPSTTSSVGTSSAATSAVGAELEVRDSRHHYRSHYALVLQVTPGREPILRLAYDRRRFDAATARRTLRQLEAVLAAFAEDLDRPLASISPLGAAESHQLLREWNDTRAAYPRDADVYAAFAEQARRRPDAIALVAAEGTLSYRRLEARAGRLAAALAGRLRALGAGPEPAVAVCAEGGLERVVAVLAILAAGATCVPLDPDLPAERLAWLAADSGAALAVAGRAQLARLPPALARGAVVLGEEEAAPDASPPPLSPPLSPPPLGAGRAFVLYTSGSTGRPKGVEVMHRGILRLVLGNDALPLGAGETLLQLAPLSFDACFLELWGALLRGGRCALADDPRPAPRALGEMLCRRRVSVLWLTASLFNAVVDEDPDALAGVAWLLAGGEALSPRHLRRARERLPGLRLVNGYGPTEGTTFTTCHPIAAADLDGRPISLGRPIANSRAHVVDRRLGPVPIAVAGELAIGGDGLARGYLGRPRESAERFVPDPFAEAPGGRLYRSGDRVRRDPRGGLDFLGRLDLQLKVRGFRIEPGEVEARLREHPGVGDAAVVAAASPTGGLVAHVAARGEAPAPAALGAFLGERLPAYMVPARFVLHAALPLGPTGKVDRAALRAAATGTGATGTEAAGTPAGGARRPPRTPAEELVAELVGTLLGVEGVGAGDDFLALGGHSLAAIRLVARLREATGVDLPLSDVLEGATVARLAAQVEARLGATPAPPLERASRAEPLPLSFAQERLWVLDRLEDGPAVYNVPLAVELEGALAVPVLLAALAALAARHESLRTRLPARSGGPVQEVLPPSPAELAVVDLGALAAGNPEAAAAEARRWTAGEAARRFDLARGPLLRAGLLRLGDERHRLLLTLHHTVADEWSLGVLARDLGALYRAALERTVPSLPPLAVQYGDYAAWQRRWLRGRALEELVAFWRARCAGVAQALELPTDRPRPALRSFAGGRRRARLAGGSGGGLRRLALEEHATSFMVLLAAFEALLHRLSGQGSFFVGTPVADRRRPETRELIGLFLDTLALPADLSGRADFRRLLARVRATVLEGFAHQDLPFERLVEALRPERDLGRSPLFQVLFVVHQEAPPALELAGLEARPVPVPAVSAKHDLTLSLAIGEEGLDGGLEAAIEYASALFDATTAERWLRAFETLLGGALADPERPLDELPLLRAAERHQVFAEWNDTAIGSAGLPGSAGEAPHLLFEARAAAAPGAAAVVCRGERWSYRRLDRLADRLAGRLRRLGVGPEAVVALALGRRPEMVAAILAVWKAGGAYLPLDPAWPGRRAAAILAESRARVVIAGAGVPVEEAALPAGVRVLRLDDGETAAEPGGEAESDPAARPPSARPDPEGLSHVIYTSGSTGRPKGVAIRHRGLARLLAWARAEHPPALLGGVLASTSICFDLSLFELFAPLTAGGTVVLAESALELPELAGSGVSLVNTVPSALAEVIAGFGLPPSVACVHLAGEPIPPALAEAVRRRPGVARFANLYGPSEDTTYSTCERIVPDRAPAPPGAARRPPAIGRPIAGTRAYLLGPRMEEVALGARGELWLAGEGLARGYLSQPARTAERFVPDPHADSRGAGARAYRTGDLARRLADGRLEFAGRLDQQVKLRGFRIELGEVEAALAAHPAVAEAAIAALGERPEARRLVAGVVVEEAASDDGGLAADPTLGLTPGLTAELRRHLAERLPAYMLPSAFFGLEALPRNANGKLDRGVLVSVLASALEGGAAPAGPFVEPRGALERRIAEVWRQVLGAERVGARDDFFSDLGGTSLQLVQAAARLQDALGRPFSALEGFRFPTVAALAEHLGSQGIAEVETGAESFEQRGARRAELRQRSLAGRRHQRRDRPRRKPEPEPAGGGAP